MTAGMFTARQGRSAPGGTFEGVPDHLRQQVVSWLARVYVIKTDSSYFRGLDLTALQQLAALLRIQVGVTQGHDMLEEVVAWTDAGDTDERLLDLIHYTLQLPTRNGKPWKELEVLFALGGSTWRVTEKGLELRVDPTAAGAFSIATAFHDPAAEHLTLAWSHAYGRNPDPSDAWDHAIKACEALLIPGVVPKQTKATLGHVVQHLRTQGHLWRLVVAGPENNYDVAPLVTMLDLIWPNPDRHEDPKDRRAPTIEEARAVVQLAVTIVQWARDDQIVRR